MGRILPRMARGPEHPKRLTSVAVTSETGGTLPTNLKAGATLKLGAKATYTDGTNGRDRQQGDQRHSIHHRGSSRLAIVARNAVGSLRATPTKPDTPSTTTERHPT